MTSGDGEQVASPPEMAANAGATAAADSAAALCYDSDDLLTQRRGGLPADRARATNGHVAPPEAPEPEGECPAEAPTVEAAPLAGPASVTDEVPVAPEEFHPIGRTLAPEAGDDPVPDVEREHSNGTVAVLAPPTLAEQQVVAVPATDAEPPLTSAALPSGDAAAADEAPSVANTDATTEPQDLTLEPAPAGSALRNTATSADGAPDATASAIDVGEPDTALAVDVSEPDTASTIEVGEPEREEASIPPAPPTADASAETLPAEPAVPAVTVNGVAHHATETAEFIPITSEEAPFSVDDRRPEPNAGEPSADETIEIPLPVAGVDDQQVLGMSSESVIDDSAIAVDTPEEGLTATADPITLPQTPEVDEPTVLAEPDLPTIPPAAPPAPPVAATPPPPPAAPPPGEGEDEEEGATMTIIEHLEELRHRITICAISVVVGAVIAWFIVPHVVHYLETAFQRLGGKFFSQTILGPFGLELKLSFLIGLIIASPVVLFQIWGFVAPGLTRREKRYALPFSLIGSGLFAAGAATGILIVPLAIQFLTHFFTVLDLEQLVDIDKYIMFIALIAVIFGITFELPIFMVGFSLLGIVNSRFFIQKFRIAIFVIFGVSMVITPGADLISPLVLGGFLTILYWLGVFLIRVIGR